MMDIARRDVGRLALGAAAAAVALGALHSTTARSPEREVRDATRDLGQWIFGTGATRGVIEPG